MKDKRIFIEILIAGLLVFSVWSFTRYHRNESILNLQAQFQMQVNGIEKTRLIIQKGLNNGGQIDIAQLNSVGWGFTVPQPAVPQPNESDPSK